MERIKVWMVFMIRGDEFMFQSNKSPMKMADEKGWIKLTIKDHNVARIVYPQGQMGILPWEKQPSRNFTSEFWVNVNGISEFRLLNPAGQLMPNYEKAISRIDVKQEIPAHLANLANFKGTKQ